ncbi:signal recognition particle-docking protein FtsY [Candidatus Pacearchaeota archaeon]|nr:signal recognition particle-docking protein FtsY [Candidatus Pacearchaeota archaeon]
MFDFLKKKLRTWLKKPEEKSVKKSSRTKKVGKKETEKKLRKQDTRTKAEKTAETEAELIIAEAEAKVTVPEIEEKEESGNFFTKLLKKITTSKLSENDFDDSFQDLEILLLENNVALDAVDALRKSLASQLIGQQIKKTEAAARIQQALKEAIMSLLQEPPSLLEQIHSKEEKPFVILFFGINGTGKTTSIAKIAYFLKQNNISCALAAGDTFRAASIEQLETHANNLKVPIVKSKYGSDPASVAFDAIKYAKSHKIQCVLIDTAGRMYTKSNLMKEMEKIIRISKPDLKLFVGESITGNDAIDQAKVFNDTAGIDGIILTKADIDKKAGTILSVSHITKKPIYFLGTGQSYNDLLPFTKKSVLRNIGLE